MPNTIKAETAHVLEKITVHCKDEDDPAEAAFNLIQQAPLKVFEDLGVDKFDPNYRKTRSHTGKFYKSLLNMKKNWTVDVMRQQIQMLAAAAAAQSPASPVDNIGGFAAGGVPGATLGTAAVDPAPSSPVANIGGLAVAGSVPRRATPSRAGAAASLGGAAFYTPAPQDRQGDLFLSHLMQMSGQMYQDMRASHTNLTEQLGASNTTVQRLAACCEETQQQVTTFVARTEEKFKEQGATIDGLGRNVGALGSNVADLQERFDELEWRVNRRISYGVNQETPVPRLEAYFDSNGLKKDSLDYPKKPKSILKNQSTPTQPFTRPNTKRSRSAEETTAVSTVSKRTTRSMSRKSSQE